MINGSTIAIFLFFFSIADQLICYIHKVSPIKTGNKANYFNCELQTGVGRVRGICFAPEKRPALENYETEKSPVKIKRARVNDKYGPLDIVLDRKTMITPVTNKLNFDFEAPLDQTQILPLLQLTQIMPGQLVSFQCKVQQVGSKDSVQLSDGTTTDRQEAIIVDATASTKFLMWGNAVGMMEKDKSYSVTKARLRKDQQAHFYVNTAKSGETTITLIDDLGGILAEIDTAPMLTIREIEATIIGISNIHPILNCSHCGKTAKLMKNIKFAECENSACGLNQLASSCTKNWFFKLAFTNHEHPSEKLHLAVFHNMLPKLSVICNQNLQLVDKDSLMECILAIGSLRVTFDNIARKVINFQKLH